MSRKSFPGTGLSFSSYGFLLAGSIALFVFWGGPFWSASRESSHFARIAISYLAVVPVAAILLARAKQLTWTHFLTTCGSAWAIKMVITVTLYEAFAPSAKLEPRLASQSSAAARAPRYRPAPAAFAQTTLAGSVTRDQLPIENALVFLEAPAAGLPNLPRRQVELIIEGARYGEPLYSTTRLDSLVLVNRDGTLHTVRFTIEGRAHSSQPLPSSAVPRVIAPPAPGLYRLTCANHSSESTWLLVFDHPYVTRTDHSGSFALNNVPLGETQLNAVAASSEGLLRGSLRTVVTEGGPPVTLQLATATLTRLLEEKR